MKARALVRILDLELINKQRLQNVTAVATSTLDDLVSESIEEMYAAELAAAATHQNDTSVFATPTEYEAELQLAAANKYTLEQNYQRRHVEECADMLSPFNQEPVQVGRGVVLPTRSASAPIPNSGRHPLCPHMNAFHIISGKW